MSDINLEALRGAYVSLKSTANQFRSAAERCRQTAEEHDRRAKDYEDMAAAASRAFVAQGGDPTLAENWYSWTYLGTNKRNTQ